MVRMAVGICEEQIGPAALESRATFGRRQVAHICGLKKTARVAQVCGVQRSIPGAFLGPEHGAGQTALCVSIRMLIEKLRHLHRKSLSAPRHRPLAKIAAWRLRRGGRRTAEIGIPAKQFQPPPPSPSVTGKRPQVSSAALRKPGPPSAFPLASKCGPPARFVPVNALASYPSGEPSIHEKPSGRSCAAFTSPYLLAQRLPVGGGLSLVLSGSVHQPIPSRTAAAAIFRRLFPVVHGGLRENPFDTPQRYVWPRSGEERSAISGQLSVRKNSSQFTVCGKTVVGNW
jgi:hypothetical protein